jgi:hypothetical protein
MCGGTRVASGGTTSGALHGAKGISMTSVLASTLIDSSTTVAIQRKTPEAPVLNAAAIGLLVHAAFSAVSSE